MRAAPGKKEGGGRNTETAEVTTRAQHDGSQKLRLLFFDQAMVDTADMQYVTPDYADRDSGIHACLSVEGL